MKFRIENQDKIKIEKLHEDSNKILAKFLVIGTFSGSIFNWVARYFDTNHPNKIIYPFSFFLIFIGIICILIINSKLNSKLVTHILSFSMMSILIVFMCIFQSRGGITVWAISIITLVASIVSVNKIAIIYNIVVGVSIEIYLWKIHPSLNVLLDSANYIGRIGIFLIAFFVVSTINKKFVENMVYELKQSDLLRVKDNKIIALEKQVNNLISESSNDGIWRNDLIENIQTYSNWWFNALGYTETEMLNLGHWLYLIHESDSDLAAKMYSDIMHQNIEYYECECRMRAKTGNYLWIRVKIKAIFGEDGNPQMMVGAYTNITPLKGKEEKLNKLAYYDSLTELPNRAYFLNKLQSCMDRAAKENANLYIIFIDLDNFKIVNDSMGHYNGDRLLKQVADRFRLVVREPNMIGRLGGDEFAIIAENIKDEYEVKAFIDDLMNSLKKPFKINDTTFIICASIGISVFPEDGIKIEELLRSADTAMYKAKEAGKNNFKLFDKSMKKDLMKKIDIENRLFTAIEKEEFYMVYQPQFVMESNRLRGFEALIRWENSEIGLINPMDFILLAEEIGYINTIGKWALKMACLEFSRLQRELDFYCILSVNISPIQFASADFVGMIKEVLEEAGFNPEYLELEVTESVFIDSLENAIAVFNELKKMGIKISLDDFGTGYSSLGYLQQLPIDTLKIDKSFISGINAVNDKNNIVRSIIGLVHDMNISVIAEGVETREQYNYLKEAECDNIQGYFLGKPSKRVESYIQEGIFNETPTLVS